MGLLITTTLHTNQGDTSEMYLNIDNIIVVKSGMQNIRINRYLNKATRETSPNNQCDCFEVFNNYNYQLTTEEIDSSNIYDVMYTKLKNDLTDQGLNVVND